MNSVPLVKTNLCRLAVALPLFLACGKFTPTNGTDQVGRVNEPKTEKAPQASSVKEPEAKKPKAKEVDSLKDSISRSLEDNPLYINEKMGEMKTRILEETGLEVVCESILLQLKPKVCYEGYMKIAGAVEKKLIKQNSEDNPIGPVVLVDGEVSQGIRGFANQYDVKGPAIWSSSQWTEFLNSQIDHSALTQRREMRSGNGLLQTQLEKILKKRIILAEGLSSAEQYSGLLLLQRVIAKDQSQKNLQRKAFEWIRIDKNSISRNVYQGIHDQWYSLEVTIPFDGKDPEVYAHLIRQPNTDLSPLRLEEKQLLAEQFNLRAFERLSVWVQEYRELRTQVLALISKLEHTIKVKINCNLDHDNQSTSSISIQDCLQNLMNLNESLTLGGYKEPDFKVIYFARKWGFSPSLDESTGVLTVNNLLSTRMLFYYLFRLTEAGRQEVRQQEQREREEKAEKPWNQKWS